MGIGRRKEEPVLHLVDQRMTLTKKEWGNVSTFMRKLQRRAKLRLRVIPNKGGGEIDE